MSPRHAAFLAAVLVATLPGCCSLARLFCGPDRSGWVSEAYSTPIEAVRTVREAIRRADTRTIFRALSEGFKQRSGMRGSIETDIAWSRMQEQHGGLHLLGYADVADAEPLEDGRVCFELTASGHRIRMVFVRQPYWEIAHGDDRIEGRFVPTVAGFARLHADPDEDTVQLSIVLPPIGGADLGIADIRRASVGHDWKLDEIRSTPD